MRPQISTLRIPAKKYLKRLMSPPALMTAHANTEKDLVCVCAPTNHLVSEFRTKDRLRMFLVNRKIQSGCAIDSRKIQISSSSFQNLQGLAVNSSKVLFSKIGN